MVDDIFMCHCTCFPLGNTLRSYTGGTYVLHDILGLIVHVVDVIVWWMQRLDDIYSSQSTANLCVTICLFGGVLILWATLMWSCAIWMLVMFCTLGEFPLQTCVCLSCIYVSWCGWYWKWDWSSTTLGVQDTIGILRLSVLLTWCAIVTHS